MKSFLAILLSTSALFVPVNGVSGGSGGDSSECPGLKAPDKVTKLDLFESEVVTNTLHVEGGELRYNNVGVFEDNVLDLRVTVTSGDYTDIEAVWISRNKQVPNHGKPDGSNFGVINLQTVEGKPKSGEGNFRMCFVKEGTNERVKLEQFSWSVYDLDERGGGCKEKFIINAFQATVFQLWPNDQESEVQVSCEDGSSTPCAAGVRTVFMSSTVGLGSDNPTYPNELTTLQKKRSVVFTFTDRDCWDFTYDHFCPADQPNYTGSLTRCSKYGGGNFLFAGNADEIITEGECLTPAPVPVTPSPTWSPTQAPTLNPTPRPTAQPLWQVKVGTIKQLDV